MRILHSDHENKKYFERQKKLSLDKAKIETAIRAELAIKMNKFNKKLIGNITMKKPIEKGSVSLTEDSKDKDSLSVAKPVLNPKDSIDSLQEPSTL